MVAVNSLLCVRMCVYVCVCVCLCVCVNEFFFIYKWLPVPFVLGPVIQFRLHSLQATAKTLDILLQEGREWRTLNILLQEGREWR